MVNIPAQWVAAGYGVPDICARHGLPATRRLRLRLISRPPGWALPLLIIGVVIYWIVVAALRQTVIAPAWPFCHECEQARKGLRRVGLTLVGLMLLSFVGGIVVIGPLHNEAGGPAFLLGLLLALAAIIVYGRANWVVASRARVSGDGQWVPVDGCAGFDAAAQAIQQAAYAAQQPGPAQAARNFNTW
ncbi:MAG: hypothetical protein AUG44_15615 [Actinobacteria bacterium 13_1_20CM_3_71_11]|nr:MAG: hypothetical protein AUG44_15615 [Actinobacteria bacterium 13_1_20CM_3_71_11]